MNELGVFSTEEIQELLFLVTYVDLGRRTRHMDRRKLKRKLQYVLALKQDQQLTNKGVLIRVCPICSTSFNTLEQRRIYCSNACKTKSCRSKTEVSK